MKSKDYQNVGIHHDLFEELDLFVKETKRYRSVSEFVHESIRLRLELLKREERLEVEVQKVSERS